MSEVPRYLSEATGMSTATLRNGSRSEHSGFGFRIEIPNLKPEIRNSSPQTPNSNPQTPNPKRQTPNAKRQTPNLKPQTRTQVFWTANSVCSETPPPGSDLPLSLCFSTAIQDLLLKGALTTETTVESGTSQSKSGTSVNLSISGHSRSA